MATTFRPVVATEDEARLVADLQSRAEPDEPADWIVKLHGWRNPTPGYERERFVVEVDGQPAGLARTVHPTEIKEDSYAYIGVFLVPEVATVDRLAEVYGFIEERTVAAGHGTMLVHVYQDDAAHSGALELRGWQRDRVSKVWELDLVDNRERLLEITAESRRKMAAQGIRCLTMAEDTDPDRYARLHQMLERAAQDIPTTVPIPQRSLAAFIADLASPDILESRYWIAKDGDRYVGHSNLKYPPVQGHVWTGFTASSPDYRGRGIARAVKMETLAQAIELGIPRVRTDNDSENAPMLHINETLGYRSLPAFQSYLKRV